jgi:hypothetical protein
MQLLIFMSGCLVVQLRRLTWKLTIPGILITALIVGSPAAFAQSNMGYKGTSSNPATSVSKDETAPDQAIKETHDQP